MQDPLEDERMAKRAEAIFDNFGEPINLIDLNMAGVSAQAARGGETIEVLTRMALTSDEELFHKIVPNIGSVIEHSAKATGAYPGLDRARTVFLVLHPDNTGQLWVDTAAMCTYSALKRPGPIPAGTVIFENDIADVTGIWFPLVEVLPEDRVLCIFREGWRFALFFDFNPDGKLSIDAAKRDLGSLYRRMRYADLYAALAHEPTFSGLVSNGWFPFLEIIAGEFPKLLDEHRSGFPLDHAEQALVKKFDARRLDRIFDRWMEIPILKSKATILVAAVKAFNENEPVSVIKIILSEIEGVMSDAYYSVHNERTHRIEKLLEFTISLAEQRAGGKDTLFFPVEFGRYLKSYTYAGFNPGDVGNAGSRHAVGHGAVTSDQYTITRALQALLTLDQLAFYIRAVPN